MFHLKNALILRNVLRPIQIRYWSTLPVHLIEQINKDLENEVYKPKNHPGKTELPLVELPEGIHNAIKTAVDVTRLPQTIESGEKLDRHLFGRQIPLEQKEVFTEKKNIQKDILKRAGVRHASDLDLGSDARTNFLKNEVLRIYYRRNYNWKPIVYDENNAWSYLLGRGSKEYAAITKVFNEIVKRDPQFQPKSFFDFGAGVGTGTWAASQLWKESIYEYFLVDESRDMNDLSELILRDGNMDKNMTLRNVFYRQFLPAADEFKSHLILSAFTLMELPDLKTRLDTLLTLWKKCDGYMVLIENGSNAGFKLINEARDFLIQQTKTDGSAYLFAPCPHESTCPQVIKDDGTPCSFNVKYRSQEIGQKAKNHEMLYSYVIFKKGSRDDDKTIDWPRMVRPTQVRTRHTRCRFCTHRGELEEVVITKAKHSKFTYRCAKKSDWGDRMPIEFAKNECDSTDDLPDDNVEKQ